MKADVVAAILVLAASLYGVFAGADFGAGLWELLSGSARNPERVRARIEHSLAPVWEANHVWLIFMLVVLWSGFPEAFAAVMTTLYIPLALAALGIVLRGSGFAFGKQLTGPGRRAARTTFALSSILTPFFMGTVVGAIAAGEVPAAGNGDPTASWIGVLPLLTGALFVASGAYLAAVFLVHDSRSASETDNAGYFARCALAAAVAAGALAAAGIVALHADARFVYDGLTGPGLPLVIGSGLCGLAALALLVQTVRGGADSRSGALLRPLAVGAVVAVVWGWGVAQHPFLLPESLTIDAAAAPDSTLNALFVVFGAALLLVVPAFVLLYTLQQKERLRG